MICLNTTGYGNYGMNTVAKGDSLENQVFRTLKDLLERDQLAFPGSRSLIFQKRAYYSDSRKGNIIFDIAIEVYRPGAAQYSLLVLIEVKNYEKKVPVDDVEEFDSKIRQVGEHNTKGIIISRSGFQDGAVNVALSKKIGLGRIGSDQVIDWLAERKDTADWVRQLSFVKGQLTAPVLERTGFFGVDEYDCFLSMGAWLEQMGVISRFELPESLLHIPYLTAGEIDERIDSLSLQHCYKGEQLDMDLLCETISGYYDVAFDFTRSLGTGVLGKIEFDPLVICVEAGLRADLHRWRFTLAHEIAHLILHHPLLVPYYDGRQETTTLFGVTSPLTGEMTQRLERQANMMAGQMLLPIGRFGEFILRYFKVNGIHRGYMYVDQQSCNRLALLALLTEIEKRFCVSKEVARIRLRELKLLEEVGRPGIGDHLREEGFL